eukprot:309299-Pyramimonas_sp.AAC.1
MVTSWAVWGPSWTVLRPPWRVTWQLGCPLRPPWDHLGGFCGRLEVKEAWTYEYAQITQPGFPPCPGAVAMR